MRWGVWIGSSVLILIGVFSACQARKTIGPPDYGPAIPADQVQNAIDNAVAAKDGTQIQKGDQVLIEHQRFVAENPMDITGDLTFDVFDRHEDDKGVYPSVTSVENFYDVDGNIQQVVKRHYELGYCKKDCQPDPPEQGDPQIVITYHNLRVSKGNVPAPDAVQQRNNCEGIPNCTLKVTNISYDQVEWHGQASQKYIHELTLSTDVPYLGNVLKNCVSGVLIVNYKGKNQPIYVRYCDSVVDFIFGSPTSTPVNNASGIPASDPRQFRDPLHQALASLVSITGF